MQQGDTKMETKNLFELSNEELQQKFITDFNDNYKKEDYDDESWEEVLKIFTFISIFTTMDDINCNFALQNAPLALYKSLHYDKTECKYQ